MIDKATAANFNGLHKFGAVSLVDNGFAYFPILLNQHEIVLSNNMETESFQPGQVGLDAFDKKTRAGILEVFPELRTSLVSYGETARLCLKTAESKVICGLVRYLMPVDVHASEAA